ncbi:methyltransferase domain-containing protein [Terrisporobacter petrolearius]|uniref:methyltransferase domain-containing protein n=1 Tax=Terrisporobacter petrolearius TaxID=1460447 RepID=UPI001D16142F|nr:methyltransferase domain-containing protein [Terrisporobacter petrolearius]MCC3865111.1 methyltransferase domain-containing protein [Terrisporobacter petrolearius]
MLDWNPDLYLKFEKERTLPAKDLISRIEAINPKKILDVGCGSGNSTHELKKRWPNSEIIGIDNSKAMIEKARSLYDDTKFILQDATDDLSALGKFDIIFSNAAIQRIPDHENLIKSLYNSLEDEGILAIQLPLVDEVKAQQALYELEHVKKYKQYLDNRSLRFNTKSKEYYYDILSSLFNPESIYIWSTTYTHAMDSLDDILKWYESTTLVPYLDSFPNEEIISNFKNNFYIKLKNVYFPRPNGSVLFNYERLFLVAAK